MVGALDRASSLSLMLCREILGYHMKDARKAQRIARQLNSSYPAHQYPITSREAKRLGLNVREIPKDLEPLLQELNLLYSEMGQRAITDYDEANHHDNEITNILEGRGTQVLYLSHVDFEKLGLPDYGDEGIPHVAYSVQEGIYKGFIAPVALYTAMGLVMLRNRKKAGDSGDGDSGKGVSS